MIVKYDNHTELAYILELPEMSGPTQREFEIKKEASHIISVEYAEAVLDVLDQIPARKYSNMADIEREIGKIK